MEKERLEESQNTSDVIRKNIKEHSGELDKISKEFEHSKKELSKYEHKIDMDKVRAIDPLDIP